MTPNLPENSRRRPLGWALPVLATGAVLWVLGVLLWGPRLAGPGSTPGLFLAGLGVLGLAAALVIRARVRSDLKALARSAREKAAEDFQALLELLPIGTAITDARGRLLRSNRRALDFFGLPEAEAKRRIGTDPDALILQPDGNPMPPSQRPLTKAIATRQGVRDVVLGLERTCDGAWVWASVSAEPLLNPDGSIREVLVTFEDVTQKRTAETELTIQTFRDRLTSLPNRTLFMERLTQAILRTERRKLATAVLYLDLDRFKVVNDSLGHEAGDHLLVHVARRLRGCLRPMDTVARLGGDEFVILFEDLPSPSEALRVAERIFESMKEPFHLHDQEVFSTCSMGLVLCTDAEAVPSELVRDAEVAMYRAKAKGEGSIEIFDPSMNAQALDRFQLESELRRALERGEFALFYQPLVSLRTGFIEG